MKNQVTAHLKIGKISSWDAVVYTPSGLCITVLPFSTYLYLISYMTSLKTTIGVFKSHFTIIFPPNCEVKSLNMENFEIIRGGSVWHHGSKIREAIATRSHLHFISPQPPTVSHSLPQPPTVSHSHSYTEKKFYDDNGYVVIDILTDQEKDDLSKEYDQVFNAKDQAKLEGTWQGDWEGKKKKMEMKSIHSLQMHSAVFTRLLLNDKLLDTCEDVMDTPNILLHHTKAHTKPPGTGSPFPMHQDYHYFPFENDSMVAVFVSVDAADPSNGGLCVYPGSHKLGPLEDISNAAGYHYLDPEKFPIGKATPLTLSRGQIVIFSYLLVHGSYDNNSDRIRRMFLIQLMSAEDVPLTKVHVSECQEMVLRGRCLSRDADIKRRHKEFVEEETVAKVV
ncbi:Phytanoyl-CoA dioxygenase, peroxisomal-like 1 [Homarus americanus]|uniref:phytanoyl-CoA dioxygenase n=1 Tax=Homarus americanus TaxID=6706 RepID=A0A8J5NBK9_HOMAM|nr:Phytanoyl-CoA dioxygenase, peroxisomal-like 1 [Homarus americanus]